MGRVVMFQDENGVTSVDVLLDEDTIWLTQQQMAELFDTDIPG